MKMQTFPLVHPSLAACARQTLAQEGVRGLYVGTLPALAAVVAENSVLFMAYGATQRAVARSLGVRQASQAERWSECLSPEGRRQCRFTLFIGTMDGLVLN